MKNIIIERIRTFVKTCILFHRFVLEEFSWFCRCMKYNNWNKEKITELYTLSVISHVLEKGITMPNRRLGFGFERVREVLNYCNKCIEKYGDMDPVIQASLDDLYEYSKVHENNNFKLPVDIQERLDIILINRRSKQETNSLEFDKETYFRKCISFTDFAKSRHSSRHFDNTPINNERVIKCIQLAQTAPSACNRQGTHVYIIDSEHMKKMVLKYQNGSRGFGETADKFLLITMDQYAWDIRQIKSGFIDAGIFAMNLLYALHEEKIAACALNAHIYRKQMKSFYQDIPIKRNEYPVLFIAIGNATDYFVVAKSARKDIESVYTIL